MASFGRFSIFIHRQTAQAGHKEIIVYYTVVLYLPINSVINCFSVPKASTVYCIVVDGIWDPILPFCLLLVQKRTRISYG